jgi:hypothetical protein
MRKPKVTQFDVGRISVLANRLAMAIYRHNQLENGRDFVPLNAGGQRIMMEIIGGVEGIRPLVDSYLIDAVKENYPHWQSVAILLISACLDGEQLSAHGVEVWQGMINDMGSTIANNSKGVLNA